MKILIGIILMISIGFCNSVTNDVIKDDIERYIQMYCILYSDSKIKIEPALIKAIIQQESRFKPYCVRFEPALFASKKWRLRLPVEYRDNKRAYCSAGLMQILFHTARNEGYTGTPDELITIENSLEFGIKHVKRLIKRYYEIEQVICAYNQGSLKKVEGVYANQKSYINPVLTFYRDKFNGKINVDELIKY